MGVRPISPRYGLDGMATAFGDAVSSHRANCFNPDGFGSNVLGGVAALA